MQPAYTILEYCYRDAANYRVHEWLLLEGPMSPQQKTELGDALIEGTWFVADAVGLPDLRPRLYEFSDGVTADDHGWHELVRVRPATEIEVASSTSFGSVIEVLARFVAAKVRLPQS